MMLTEAGSAFVLALMGADGLVAGGWWRKQIGPKQLPNLGLAHTLKLASLCSAR